ncbi:MAG: YitT family protein [Cellulosilyticaceae bacterium]
MPAKKQHIAMELLGLIVGCIIVSIGINMFLKPYTIAPGGISGLAVVLNRLTGVSVSLVMLVIGIPLVVLAYRILGKANFVKTLVGTILFSAIVGITEPLSQLRPTNDLLLSAVSGGLLIGIGLGIMLRSDASTGGTDLIALMLSKKFPGIKITQFMVCIDAFVVISSGVVSGNLEIALYSAIALYVEVKVVDAIMNGFDYSKSFIIISEHADWIKRAITEELKRGVTILKGKGGYTEADKQILLVAVPRNQEVTLKRLIKETDPSAFIMISTVQEVVGEGFKPFE